jgi:uncharacterized protein DUF3830
LNRYRWVVLTRACVVVTLGGFEAIHVGTEPYLAMGIGIVLAGVGVGGYAFTKARNTGVVSSAGVGRDRFPLPRRGVAAPARLLRGEEAPETCRAVLDALPAAGLARHGIYSGSEVYLILPQVLAPRREHATTIVGPGDVGFLTVEEGSRYGIAESYSEVCWFYDLDATPSMPEGPIAVNAALRHRLLLRRLPTHAARGREKGRDHPRIGASAGANTQERWPKRLPRHHFGGGVEPSGPCAG